MTDTGSNLIIHYKQVPSKKVRCQPCGHPLTMYLDGSDPPRLRIMPHTVGDELCEGSFTLAHDQPEPVPKEG